MQPGALIGGRFEVEQRVGAGGMGTVFRAKDRTTGAPVALKVLNADVEQGLERFMREATTLSRLRHPDIVEYVAHGTLPEGAYLVTEWLEGLSLSARINRPGFSMRDTLLVARSIARALGAGHRANVVHRDVKPGNVMLVEGDATRAKLLDFGIARLGSERTLTAIGTMLGTPGYMAPEQARGMSNVGPSADVFGLGAIIYRCLAGRAPFAADSAVGVLAKTLLDEPEPLAAACPNAAGPIAEAVHAMLSKEPSGRPADGDVAAELIERLLALEDRGTVLGESTKSVRELPSLTTTERRIVTVLFVAPRSVLDEAPTLIDDAPVLQAAAPISDVERAVAEEHGLRLERLVSGARVLTIAGVGSAKEQALRVVRAALKLAPLSPGATLGVATGRGELRGRSAVGEAIERAERTTHTHAEVSPEARIFVDDVTAGLVEDAVELSRERDVWRVLGDRPPATGARMLLGKPSPCVGRERELAMLSGLLQESMDERVARVAVVTAPPGYGKSRLRHEWLARLEQTIAPRVLLARADPMTAGSPLAMLRQLLAQAMGVHDGDTPEVARARLNARASALFREADRARIVEFVSELVGCGTTEASAALAAARRDPVLLGDQLHRAALDVFASLVDQGPLVVVLEDLHWGDLSTVRFVSEALRILDQRPFVAVAFARPEVKDLFPDVWVERGASTIRLTELTRGAAERLVRHALADKADAAVVERIVTRALGNALFLEELVRQAAEGKHEGTPETVRVMMHARLDGFEPEARRVLRAASVFGQAFWADGVRELVVDDDDAFGLDVDEWLRVLCAREVVGKRVTSRFANRDEYVFGHALVREAAYDMLTDQDRRVGHGLAGEWLASNGETDGVALGEHFERGGVGDRASHWFARAAERALAGNDFAGAITLARRAMALDTDPHRVGALYLLIAQASRWKGAHKDALEAALAARELLEPGSVLWYRTLGETAVESAPLGRADVVMEVLDALLRTPTLPGAEGAFAAAASRTSIPLLVVIGRKDAAPPLLERLFATSPEVCERDPIARGSIAQARAYIALSESDAYAYQRHCRDARDAFLQSGDIRTGMTLSTNIGYAAMNLGDVDSAELAMRDGLSSAVRMGLRRIEAVNRHNLGILLARRGRYEEAEREEREAMASLEAQGDRRLGNFARAYFAEILRQQGRLTEALEHGRRACENAQGFSGPLTYALTVVAATLFDAGDVKGALERITEARALVDVTGAAEDGDAFLRLVQARALEANRDVAGARVCIEDAKRRLDERLARLPDDAARKQFIEGVPEHADTLTFAARLGVG